MERTLCIIKPDGVERGITGKIITRIEEETFNILGIKRACLTREVAEDFYAVHREKPFFQELVEFMTSGPVVLVALEGEDAVNHWREVIGATNPADAADGTVRRLYAESLERNTVHGSDSVENGLAEVGKFFSEKELIEQR